MVVHTRTSLVTTFEGTHHPRTRYIANLDATVWRAHCLNTSSNYRRVFTTVSADPSTNPPWLPLSQK